MAKQKKRYFATRCGGVNIAIKIEGKDVSAGSSTFETKCPMCGEPHNFKEVSKFVFKRLTAQEKTCANCGEPILHLSDRKVWVHNDEVLDELHPDYGVLRCAIGGGVAEPDESDTARDLQRLLGGTPARERKNPTRDADDARKALSSFAGLGRTTR